MPHINIMSMIGSAVPPALQSEGVLACWYVVIDGVQRSGPFTSLDAALASQSIWQFELAMRHKDIPALAA